MNQYAGAHPQDPDGRSTPPRALGRQEERTLAAAAHGVPLVAFVLSAGTLGFLASLVIYLVYRDRGPFVRMHAVNSLNAQLSVLLYLVVSGIICAVGAVLLVVLVGIVPLLLGGLGILASLALLLWVHCVGAVRAWDGQPYDPPLTIRFIR